VLTDSFRPENDIDVLIDFEPDQTPGLFALARIQFETEAVVGSRRLIARGRNTCSRRRENSRASQVSTGQ
jgi:hypothetical protein